MKKTAFRLASIFIAFAMVLVILGPATALAEGGEGQQIDGTGFQKYKSEGHTTGLEQATPKEKAAFDKLSIDVTKVMPNKMAIASANTERKAQGMSLLPASLAVSDEKTLLTEKDLGTYGALATDTEWTEGLYGSTYPSEQDNSTKSWFPAIGDQNPLNSCASFTTTYYLMTYQTAKMRGWNAKSDSNYRFSPKFTYNLINGGQDRGTSLEANFLTLHINGAMLNSQGFAYDGNETDWPTKASQWRDAMKYKINLFSDGAELKPFGEIKELNKTDKYGKVTGVNNLKQKLANGDIVTIGTRYFYDWLYTRVKDVKGTQDDPYVGQRAVALMFDGDYYQDGYSGHALTIVGYNENIWIDCNNNGSIDTNEKGAFKVVNSWGTDTYSWPYILGDTKLTPGTVWLSYNAFRNMSDFKFKTESGYQSIHIADVAEDDECYFLTVPSKDYTPTLTANVTVTTNDRYDLTAFYGINWAEATEPMQDHSFTSSKFSDLNILHYINDGILWSYHWSDEIGATENLSFDGRENVLNPSQAQFAIDLTPYLHDYSVFQDAGGPLDINLGILDSSNTSSQKVNAITFKNEKTGQTFDALEFSGPTIVDNKLQWFYARNILNPSAALPVDAADVAHLSDMPLDSVQSASSTDPNQVWERKFTPDTTAVYSLSFTGGSSDANIEILNNARYRLYWGMADSGSKIEQRLYAGKTYVLRAYPGTGATSFNVTLSKIPDSDLNLDISNSDLSGITTSIAMDKAFDKDTKIYTINLTEAQPSVTIEATKEFSGATVTVDGTADSKTIKLDTGTSKTVNITATSQDMVYTKTYTITIHRAPSTDATLLGISASGYPDYKLAPEFLPGTYNYTLTIPELTGSVTITPAISNAHAIMSIDGAAVSSKTVTLANGASQVVRIHVVSQSGTSGDYSILVNREKSNNSQLSGIKLSTSKLSPALNAGTLNYNVALSESTGSVTITPTMAMQGSTMTINGSPATSVNLTPDNGQTATATIIVTSQSGSSQTTYTVNAARANSTDSYLYSLTASNGAAFTKAISRTRYTYTLNLPELVDSTTITLTPENHNAIVQFVSGTTDGTVSLANGASVTVKIKVTAQAGGKYYKYYTIKVQRPKSNNNNLETLTDSLGRLLPVFNPANTSQTGYTISLGENETSVTIHATQQEPHATLRIDGKIVTDKTFTLATTGAKKEVKITVRSQAGKTKTYIVRISRANSTNALLSSITVKPLGYPLSPDFSADMLEYTVHLPANISKVTFSAAKQSGYATILFDNRKTTSKTVSVLPESYTDVYIKVTAQDGTTWRIYHVHVTRGAGV